MKTFVASALASFFLMHTPYLYANSCGDLDVKYNLFDITNEEIFHNGEGTPGPRRLVTDQTSNIVSLSSKRLIQTTLMDIDSLTLDIQKVSGSRIGGKTTLVICTIDENKYVEKLWEFSVRGGKRNINDHWQRHLVGLKDKKLAVRLVGKSPTGSARFRINLIRPNGEGKIWQPIRSVHSRPVDGFADLHVHQAASLAYSGGWYWGSHDSPFLSIGVPACDGHNHANLSSLGLHHIESFLGSHNGEIYGYPSFRDWPRWDDIKHQQVSQTWLKQAHNNGLNLIVASVVNNQWLSAAAVASGKHNNSFSPADMEAAKRQIVSLKKMAEKTQWYEIVRDPWEARRAIEAGKLAVVLAVEVSDLMPRSDGPWLQQLHDLYDMGVRNIQLAHESNSIFSGAAYHRDAFKYNSRIKAWFDRDINYASGGNGVNNPIGLTSEGEKLLQEMIRLNMLIDIAHLPLKTQRQIHSITSQKNSYYPLFNSHTRLGSLLKEEDRSVLKEHQTTDEVLHYIRQSGGMLGLRTGEEAMLDYTHPQKGSPVENNCDGSSRSFTQFYQYADDAGVKLAFGSDFNGFITQMPPRFGDQACASAPTNDRNVQIQAQGQPNHNAPSYVQEFNYKGLAHIGLLPGLLHDMKNLGADTTNIENSAENFIKMWERAYNPNRQAIP
ncbi:membrane dipeptidase [Agarilytica rhodophyticola]|uniref:membrane dipeptidase n=1 Tax=Agarilytica rhodophyticola TaxID=1737490 RepID=UPI000B3414B1|nr:membrane dipeptidase [Agarilytica rhodophyticola]